MVAKRQGVLCLSRILELLQNKPLGLKPQSDMQNLINQVSVDIHTVCFSILCMYAQHGRSLGSESLLWALTRRTTSRRQLRRT